MKRIKTLFIVALCFFSVPFWAVAQSNYPNQEQVAQRLRKITTDHARVAKLESLTKTDGGNDIYVLRLGAGDVDAKPAIAVVGGVEGFHLLGTELALRFAENLVKDHQNLLNTTTFYIFPSMSPDASAQYFKNLKYERRANGRNTDIDRDGRLSEDPFEDLNGDGLITLIRVEDPSGTFISHPADPRVLIKANTEKGERGKYLVFSEGIDNDKDGKFNEDGEGGIFFNKNWSYQYPAFADGAGDFPVSEKETRAIADYLYDRWNVYAVFTFGPANNLSKPMVFNRQAASQRIVTSILEGDQKINASVSELYNKTISQKNAPDAPGTGGDFFQWAYFHYGKLSFSTPGWWAPQAADKKDDPNFKPNTDRNAEVNFLRWAEETGVNDVFVDWKEIQHPDFPGKKVEVGGIKPFVMYNPPYTMVEGIAKEHTDFIVKFSDLNPGLALVNEKIEKLDNNVYRVTIDLKNTSTLPTHSELGNRAGWLKRIRVETGIGSGQKFLTGRGLTLVNSIAGDGQERMVWLIQGRGNVTIKAGAPHTGFVTKTLNLN
jgi:hypothetical protein